MWIGLVATQSDPGFGRDAHGRLGVVYEAPEYTMNAGKLSADFGLDGRGFVDGAAARAYIEPSIY